MVLVVMLEFLFGFRGTRLLVFNLTLPVCLLSFLTSELGVCCFGIGVIWWGGVVRGKLGVCCCKIDGIWGGV